MKALNRNWVCFVDDPASDPPAFLVFIILSPIVLSKRFSTCPVCRRASKLRKGDRFSRMNQGWRLFRR
jgi:hypothetical protein